MTQVIEKPKRIRIKKDVFKNAELGKSYKTREQKFEKLNSGTDGYRRY